MTPKLIFITGATGFIGSEVAAAALDAGYRVRLSVRKSEQIEKLQVLFAPHAAMLEFAIIPDITNIGAFKGKLDGVSFIFHLASPMPGKGTDVRLDYVAPAVQGTEAILSAAASVKSVERVVLMASMLSLIPMGALRSPGLVVKENQRLDLSVNLDADFPSGWIGDGMKYQASKILGHQATLAFMERHKPHFVLRTLHPSFVLGRSLVQTTADGIDGINARLWKSLHSERPLFPSVCVHVRDVAEAHLRALDITADGETEILLSGPRFLWDDVAQFVKTYYPQIGVKLQPPFDHPIVVDTSRADKLLGIKWRPMEDIVGDVVDQQLSFG